VRQKVRQQCQIYLERVAEATYTLPSAA
jgi:hypothetical protein